MKKTVAAVYDRRKNKATTRRSQSAATAAWALAFTLNGKRVSKKVKPTQTLLDFLRIEMGLTGTKGACEEGECGSCYVLVDGKPMNSCMMLAPQVQDREVVTIEGLAKGKRLDVIQQKFIECGAVQCGYCTPGLILAAKALLKDNPHPSREEFLVGMEGNICRCTGYNKILRACELAADELGLKK
jgi:carbon-monoxide dehydrogenase small subunit